MSDVPLPNQPARPVHPGEMDEKLSLREFEQRMESLRIWLDSQLTHIRELEGVRGAALTKALELQASEIARRLEELNHAHAIARENWAQSLPRELFDSRMADWDKWREVVNTSMSEGRQRTALIASLSERVSKYEAWRTESEAKVLVLQQDAKDVINLKADVEGLKANSQNFAGAITLAKGMGYVGVVAFLIAILRLAGVVK